MSSSYKTSSKPPLACEIAADRVLAGRVRGPATLVEICASYELAPGSVVPDLIETNLRRPRWRSRQRIRDALGSVGGRSRDVIAVLPDAAVRVVLLDFETLPANREEAEGVVRFRLKKSLPFDLEKARVSYHAQPARHGVRVVAAVVLNSVLEEYESAFREAGYSPGMVMPSMLAALGRGRRRPAHPGGQGGCAHHQHRDPRPAAVAAVPHPGKLRGVTITGEQLAEEVYPSVVFFQDTYHLNIDRIYVAGLPDAGGAAPALRAQTGAEVKELVGASQLGASGARFRAGRMAGVVGALLS